MFKQRHLKAFAAAANALFAAFVLAACVALNPPASDNRHADQESSSDGPAAQQGPLIETVLTGLTNPRGVVVLPDGSLMVAEAGSGYNAVDPRS